MNPNLNQQKKLAFNSFPELGRFALVAHQFSHPSLAKLYKQWESLSSSNELICLLGPQHGFDQTEQDNMIETEDRTWMFHDKPLPLYSLYGPRWSPPDDLNLQTLIFHLPDVGCRIYTYMSTLAKCLTWCEAQKVRLILWDFPNPLGLCRQKKDVVINCGGPVFDLSSESYLSFFNIPLRHGLTMGELGHWFCTSKQLNVTYDVIPVPGLIRGESIKTTGQRFQNMYPFFFPSPNLPTWEACVFFLSFVILEATTMSEGRGTTKPFQLIGHPQLKHAFSFEAYKEFFVVTPCAFRPQFNKHSKDICKGWLFSLNSEFIQTASWEWLGIELILWALKNIPSFEFRSHPYEYGSKKALDLILGAEHWLDLIQRSEHLSWPQTLKTMEDLKEQDLKDTKKFLFEAKSQRIFLYK
jgi:uncharacterized protein YbbC (DUF1343 family)